MWNKPTKIQLKKIPALYSTEKVALEDKKVKMHFFIGGSDWYVVEYDPIDQLFWGFVVLNGDTQNAEWGYFAYSEIRSAKSGFVEIDRDRYFKVSKAKDIEKIKTAQGW